MQNITLNINNPQIEHFLFNLSKKKNKSIETYIYDIILQHFNSKVKDVKFKPEIIDAINSKEQYVFKEEEFFEISKKMLNNEKVNFEKFKQVAE